MYIKENNFSFTIPNERERGNEKQKIEKINKKFTKKKSSPRESGLSMKIFQR